MKRVPLKLGMLLLLLLLLMLQLLLSLFEIQRPFDISKVQDRRRLLMVDLHLEEQLKMDKGISRFY